MTHRDFILMDFWESQFSVWIQPSARQHFSAGAAHWQISKRKCGLWTATEMEEGLHDAGPPIKYPDPAHLGVVSRVERLLQWEKDTMCAISIVVSPIRQSAHPGKPRRTASCGAGSSRTTRCR